MKVHVTTYQKIGVKITYQFHENQSILKGLTPLYIIYNRPLQTTRGKFDSFLSTYYLYVAVRLYRGADKSLARPGRKQANVSVRIA